MKLNFKVLALLGTLTASLMFFQNCDSGGSLTLERNANNSSLGGNNSALNSKAPTAAELEGVWMGSCERVPAPASGSFRMNFTFGQPNNVSVQINGYSDTACATQTFFDAYTGNFVLAASSVAGAGRINFTVLTAQRAPVGAANAAAFNAAQMCGQMGWVANTGKAIAPGTACLLFSTQSSTVIGIDGTKLYFGNDADTALDPARIYNKQ